MDHLLLPSKPLTTLLTFQTTAELQHTDSIMIITKTQQDVILNTRRTKDVKERHMALYQFHNAALHKYNHIVECSQHYCYGSKEACSCGKGTLR